MPTIRLLLVGSLLLAQFGCSSSARQVTHRTVPVPVVSSSDVGETHTVEREDRYQLTKLPTDETPVAVSYLPGSRPAGTVLGFERTAGGLFALCGTHRIPLEPTAHRWERLEDRIVPDAERVSSDWFPPTSESILNAAILAGIFVLSIAVAAAISNSGFPNWVLSH